MTKLKQTKMQAKWLHWLVVIGVFVLLLITLTATGYVLASPPPIPSSFYGTVSINGENAPLNVQVSAWINGQWIMSVPVTMHNGTTMYSMDIPGDNLSTSEIEGGRHGDEVFFHIGFQPADQTGTWISGSNQVLNLTAHQEEMLQFYFPLVFR